MQGEGEVGSRCGFDIITSVPCARREYLETTLDKREERIGLGPHRKLGKGTRGLRQIWPVETPCTASTESRECTLLDVLTVQRAMLIGFECITSRRDIAIYIRCSVVAKTAARGDCSRRAEKRKVVRARSAGNTTCLSRSVYHLNN
eukprot:scaffold18965_cov33-Tisochrysis_lutea.AAC.4